MITRFFSGHIQLRNSLTRWDVRFGSNMYLKVLEYCRLLSLDLLRADSFGEMAEQLVSVLLVHPAKLRRPLRYLMERLNL